MSLLSELLDIVNHGEAPDIGELQAGDFVHSHYFQVVSVIRKHAAQPPLAVDLPPAGGEIEPSADVAASH